MEERSGACIPIVAEDLCAEFPGNARLVRATKERVGIARRRIFEGNDVKSQEATVAASQPAIDACRAQRNENEFGKQNAGASIKRLAEALNEVRRRCPNLPVLAIPWMHARHPIHPVQQELMAEGYMSQDAGETDRVPDVEGRRRAGSLVLRFGLCLLYAAYLTVRLVQLRLCRRREIAALKRQRFDLVAKTWGFGTDRTADARDFYYGDLQKRLEERGLKMLLLFGDPRGRNWRAASAAFVSICWPGRLPELCLVPLLAPLQMACLQLMASMRLNRFAAGASDPLVRRVAMRASDCSLSRQITPLGLYYWIGKAAIKIWHPRAFVTLYEGHGWEQCARWGTKTADSTCQTVGYQHTILLRHNLALLQRHDEEQVYSKPDVVLCLGPRTQTLLRCGHGRSTLVTFGTFRRSPDAYVSERPSPQKCTVLVLPEGDLEEEKLLFNSAMRVAQMLPEYRFIFRCHPVLPFEQIREHLEQDPGNLPNVELSDHRRIDEDFSRSSVILYRGSSSVLYAVLHGLKPVYLHDDRYHEVDPLFELNGWRVRVCSIQELEQSLRQYAQTDASSAAEAWREAADYVDTYAIPVDGSSVDRFLSVIGLTDSVTTR